MSLTLTDITGFKRCIIALVAGHSLGLHLERAQHLLLHLVPLLHGVKVFVRGLQLSFGNKMFISERYLKDGIWCTFW